jgi:hypothetical protein
MLLLPSQGNSVPTKQGFQTPLYELSEYLKWTTNGKIQLPDFQRGYSSCPYPHRCCD